MAWITPPVFVALQTLTDTVMNQLSSRLSDLWTATTIGDMSYASATDALSRLAIGSASQLLATNSGATAPEWVSLVPKREGGHASNWTTSGTTEYTPTNAIIQAGSINVDATTGSGPYYGTSAVTYPDTFGQVPLVFLTPIYATDVYVDAKISTNPTTSGFTARVVSSGSSSGIAVMWLAIGEPA